MGEHVTHELVDRKRLDVMREEALMQDGVWRVLVLDSRGRIVAPTDDGRVALRVLQLAGELTLGRDAIRLLYRCVMLREAYARGLISVLDYLTQADAATVELTRFIR